MTNTVTKERKETTKTTKTAKILPWAIAAVASAMLFANAPSKIQTNAEPIIKDFTNEQVVLANEEYQVGLTDAQKESMYLADSIKGAIPNTEPLDDDAINYQDVLNQHPDFVVTANGGSMTKLKVKIGDGIFEYYKPVRGIRVTNVDLTDAQISSLNSVIKAMLHGRSSDYIKSLESNKIVDSNGVQTAYGAVVNVFKGIGIDNPKFEVFE